MTNGVTTLQAINLENTEILRQGFDTTNNTLKDGFSGLQKSLSVGLKSLTTSIETGFEELGRTQNEIISIQKAANQNLNRMSEVLQNPTKQKSIELSKQAIEYLEISLSPSKIINLDRSLRLIKDAKTLLMQSIDAWSSNAEALFNLGWIEMYLEGDTRSAAFKFETAFLRYFKANPEMSIKSLRHLAEAQFQQNSIEVAIQSSLEALSFAEKIGSNELPQIEYDTARYMIKHAPKEAAKHLESSLSKCNMLTLEALSEDTFQTNQKVCDLISKYMILIALLSIEQSPNYDGIELFVKKELPVEIRQRAILTLGKLEERELSILNDPMARNSYSKKYNPYDIRLKPIFFEAIDSPILRILTLSRHIDQLLRTQRAIVHARQEQARLFADVLNRIEKSLFAKSYSDEMWGSIYFIGGRLNLKSEAKRLRNRIKRK